MKVRFLVSTLTIGLAAFAAACGSGSVSGGGTNPATRAAASTFLGQLQHVTPIGSTVPANGDVNPYGVASVTASVGKLTAGDTLVSNFNDKANVQGTGSTIVEVSPTGSTQLFAQVSQLPAGSSCPGGIGLTTALGILPGGWVVVGSLPTTKGGTLPNIDPAGCLIVLDDEGSVVETITNRNIVGPWDLAVDASATTAAVFVSNSLGGNTSTDNGTPVAGNCTVVRLDLTYGPKTPPVVTNTTVVGTHFPWHADKAALVLAPTGLAVGSSGKLYVDDTQTNSISAIPDALTRSTAMTASATTISSGGSLDAPLGMTSTSNGDFVVVNGNDGNAVEVSPQGKQIGTKTLVRNGAGDLFGIISTQAGNGILFVNDGSNVLDLSQT